MSLEQTILTIQRLEEQLATVEKRYSEEKQSISLAIRNTRNELKSLEAGLDVGKIKLAKTLMYVAGDYGPAGDDRSVVKEAIEDVTQGFVKLRTEYLATKNYDRFYHQATSHTYGYGPRHGSVVFEIGLHSSTRSRLSSRNTLTEQEREAMLYYLVHIDEIKRIEKEERR